MKDIWKKHQLGIISIGYIIAVILLIYFGLFPFEKKIRNQSDRIQEKTLENEIFEKRIAKVVDLEAQLDDYQKNKDQLGTLLQGGEEIDFIKKIEILAEETKNKISLKILDTEEKKANTSKDNKNEKKEVNLVDEMPYKNFLSLEMKLEGNYSDLISFFKKIENANYYLDVVSLNMEKTTIIETDEKKPETDIFSSLSNLPAEKKEKEILKSTINVIVYKK